MLWFVWACHNLAGMPVHSGVLVTSRMGKFGLGAPILLHMVCNDVDTTDVGDKVGGQGNVTLVNAEYAARLVIREQEGKQRPVLLLDEIRDPILEEQALYPMERVLIIYLAEITFIADHATIKIDL